MIHMHNILFNLENHLESRLNFNSIYIFYQTNIDRNSFPLVLKELVIKSYNFILSLLMATQENI